MMQLELTSVTYVHETKFWWIPLGFQAFGTEVNVLLGIFQESRESSYLGVDWQLNVSLCPELKWDTKREQRKIEETKILQKRTEGATTAKKNLDNQSTHSLFTELLSPLRAS